MPRPIAQRAATGRIPSERRAIAKRIRQTRIERGWSQARLAKALGVTAMAVSQWESAKIAIRRARLAAIASALAVPIGELTGENAERSARRRDFCERMIKHFRGCPNCHAHVEFMARAVAETQHPDDKCHEPLSPK